MSKIKKMIYISIGTALLAVCSWIAIPFTIPFTLQTFAIFTIAGLLTLDQSLLSVIIYILLGVCGIPVFSGFKSGLGTLLGATGGYISGFVFTVLIIGLAKKCTKNKYIRFASYIVGTIVCYMFGTAWYVYVYGSGNGFVAALSLCVYPYIIPDLVKLLLSLYIVKRVKPHITIK